MSVHVAMSSFRLLYEGQFIYPSFRIPTVRSMEPLTITRRVCRLSPQGQTSAGSSFVIPFLWAGLIVFVSHTTITQKEQMLWINRRLRMYNGKMASSLLLRS